MKRLAFWGLAVFGGVLMIEACTSAIVSPQLSRSGKPMLWKNRDTGFEDNFVAAVNAHSPEEMDYVALFNAGDSLLADAWIGVNRAGFAIMNTASYNLAPDTAKYKDKEGEVMTAALKSCHTVDDFERLLNELPKPLGVQANFGVIDGQGGGAYFETDDYKYVRYNLVDEDSGVMFRTNYSCSGTEDVGFGYIRENNARHLLLPHIESGCISPEVFTDGLSRSFYHSLLGGDMLEVTGEWMVDQDFIPRKSTSASVVIEIGESGEPVMWTVLGYPPCSYARKVTIDSVPDDMRPDPLTWHSPFCDEVNIRKREVFPIKRGSGSHYINVSRLREYNEMYRRKSLEETFGQ